MTFEEGFRMLGAAAGRCTYCLKEMKMCSFQAHDRDQFTFDRVDNGKAHSSDNCVVSCLECNVKRGRKNFDDFYMISWLNVPINITTYGIRSSSSNIQQNLLDA
jgi:hypothetical protein